MTPCPSQLELKQLVDDALDEHHREKIELHIEACQACQDALEDLASGEDSAELSRPVGIALGQSDPLNRHFVSNVVQSLKKLTLPKVPAPNWQPPEFVGEYRIISTLGHGGMGIVYEAEHASLGRRVALKVLPKHFSNNASAILRFEREVRAAAKMHHTNIVPIFEVGQEDEYLFYAMQLISGQSLDRWIKDQASPSTDSASATASMLASSSTASQIRQVYRSIAEIGVGAADALEYAHTRGIIHRDVKPSNLLQDDSGVVWLTDFGLAKADDDGMTQSGEYLGTLRYMSPERFRGECDERADIYALGITLYELLTCRPAFSTPDQLELIHQIKEKQPTRLCSVDPRIPRDLETIVFKAIEKEPEQRYPSASALADDLGRFLDDEPIVARRATLREQLLLWKRRNPTLAASVAALFLVLLIGVAATSWKWREADLQRSLAQEQTEAARDQREEARWQNYRANMATASSALQLRAAESLKLALEACEPEFRGWEWRYFRNQLARWNVELDCTPGNTKTVVGIQFRDADSTLVTSWLNEDGGSQGEIFDVNEKRKLKQTNNLYAPFGMYQAAAPRQADAELCVVSPLGGYRTQQAEGELRLQELADDSEEILEQTVLAPDNGRAAIPAFSHDDRLVASWCADRVVRIWETATGEVVAVLEGKQPLVTALEFNSDGSRLMGCGFIDASDWPAKTCSLWDTVTGERLFDLNQEDSPRVHIHEFSTDGRLLAVGREYPSNVIEIWDLRDATRLAELKAHDNTIRSLAISRDASRLIATSLDRTVSVWDLVEFRLLRKLEGPSELPGGVFFNRDESSLLVVSQRGATQVRDSNSFRVQNVYMTQELKAASEAVSHSTDTLAVWFFEGKIRLWDLSQSQRTLIRSHTSYVYDLQIGPNGAEIASVGWDNTLRIHDLATAQQLAAFSSPDDRLLRLRYSPDGSRILATYPGTEFGGRIYVWKTKPTAGETSEPVVIEHPRPHARVGEGFGATFSPDSQQIIAGSSVEALYVWNAETGTQEQVVPAKGLPPISDVSLSPNGRWMLTAGGCLALWDAVTYKKKATLGKPDHAAYAATWSADSKLVAATDETSTVRLWNIETSDLLATLRHGVQVYDAAFSPDGKRLATACDDNTIRLWDLEHFEQVAELWQHSSYVHAVDFDSAGTRLASGSGDHSIRIWDIVSASERAKAQHRNSTAELSGTSDYE